MVLGMVLEKEMGKQMYIKQQHPLYPPQGEMLLLLFQMIFLKTILIH